MVVRYIYHLLLTSVFHYDDYLSLEKKINRCVCHKTSFIQVVLSIDEDVTDRRYTMPKGKGTYGSKVGRPPMKPTKKTTKK